MILGKEVADVQLCLDVSDRDDAGPADAGVVQHMMFSELFWLNDVGHIEVVDVEKMNGPDEPLFFDNDVKVDGEVVGSTDATKVKDVVLKV